MFDWIIQRSIAQRWLVMIVFMLVAAIGVWNAFKLPIDAVPDITNVQVQINTEAEGYSPLETESRISYPIENALSGIPHLKYTRSISRYGLSQVTVVFEDRTDIYFARQLINERLQSVLPQLPSGVSPTLGPVATGLGEIFMYTVENKPNAVNPYSPTELRSLQDWVIKPQLRTVAGVTEINSIGGYVKQVEIIPNFQQLQGYGLTLRDLAHALSDNNQNVGAGYIERRGSQYLVRSLAQHQSLQSIQQLAIKAADGQMVLVQDVATVQLGQEIRNGAATKDGKEVVLGTVFMLIGENSRQVASGAAQQLQEIQRSLPEGVIANPVYDRTTLVDATIATVQTNLLEGAILVIAVLFAFLGHIRAAIITALVIPLAMLMTITGMANYGISANLMSLGALDFGIIIDGAVVIVEQALSQLAARQRELGRVLTRKERFETVFAATQASRKALIFGQLIIISVYLPLLTLTGVEGKMFTPMAMTVVLALMAAMLLSVTFVPAALALFTSGSVKVHENKLLQACQRFYRPLLTWSMSHRLLVVCAAGVVFVFSTLLLSRLGTEFMPSLDEGDVAMHALRIPGTSLSQSVEMQYALEREIAKIPEVQTIFAKIGTAEIATDPVPPSVADNFIVLKPRDEWADPDKPKAEVVAAIQRASEQVIGNKYEYTQPIQMRFNELLSGVRADVAIKVFGDDMAELTRVGKEIEAVLSGVAGSADVQMEQVTGLPMINIQPKQAMLVQYGLSIAEAQQIIRTAIAGQKVGDFFEGDRRSDIVIRLAEPQRHDVQSLQQIRVSLPNDPAATLALGDLVTIEELQGPNQVSRENGKRRLVVTANVRDRDIGSFIAQAQQQINTQVSLPAGYWIKWGGTFEQLESAKSRLMLVIPAAILVILGLLYLALGSIKNSVLVFVAVPFALCGGVIALTLRGLPLSISAAVGFIALSGVAVLNGLVLLSAIQALREKGVPLFDAVIEGTMSRLRAVLMTAFVAALGFIPMAFNVGIGAEVQRPLATVVIGGIVSSTLLTLLLLPLLYEWLNRGKTA
ncbi:MAG: CusA/CzcA family heavy metal efflux RND transporter [Moraxellaceae bacterium]